jgi:GrpB-like predicted nucleotidyltransferase (UPF0157 family)
VAVPVIMAEYDPRWPALYDAERDRILAVTGNSVLRIEHIGSTAVPGLGSKPIIDIMAAVRRLQDAEGCIPPLQGIGYEYVPEYNELIPERRYFHKGPPEARTFHLHMVELTSEFWERQLLFRDWLRSHPEDAQEYHELKQRLAAQFGNDREGYTEAKGPFIESIVARARLGEG